MMHQPWHPQSYFIFTFYNLKDFSDHDLRNFTVFGYFYATSHQDHRAQRTPPVHRVEKENAAVHVPTQVII
jgi:hypothetical protein